MAFLTRRHGSLPTDALQKPLMGHSLSVPTHAENLLKVFQNTAGWEKIPHLPPQGDVISSETLPPALCPFPNILLFPSAPLPWKNNFLISTFTALGCSNCCCIRTDKDVLVVRTWSPLGANSAKTSAPGPWQWYGAGSPNSSPDWGQKFARSFF